MKKLPHIGLSKLVPYGLTLTALGFFLMQTDVFMHIGAIFFPLGLLPFAITHAKNKD
ncbi:hypothetical protein [Limnohabitans sp. MORI2]|uniref:hypothetical protein n=1 Tax=Limnohabitans sp. MORI2 TaxID=1751150 RepID=UPI00249191CE|nr:hypothetical protein [Limnohabitans sp. MORI2]